MDPLLHYLSTNLETLRSFLLEGLYVQMVQEVWYCTLRQITLSVLALGTPLYYRHLLKRLQELEGFFLQRGAERVPAAAERRRSALDAPDSASAAASASDADAATPTPGPSSQNQSQSVSSPKSQPQQEHQQLARRDSQYERLLRETASLLESLEFSLAYRTRSTELLALEAFEWVIESVGKSVRLHLHCSTGHLRLSHSLTASRKHTCSSLRAFTSRCTEYIVQISSYKTHMVFNYKLNIQVLIIFNECTDVRCARRRRRSWAISNARLATWRRRVASPRSSSRVRPCHRPRPGP